MAEITERQLLDEILSMLIDIDARVKIIEGEVLDLKIKAVKPDEKIELTNHLEKIEEYYNDTKTELERRYPGHTVRRRGQQ